MLQNVRNCAMPAHASLASPSDFFRRRHLFPHSYNLVDSSRDCVFQCFTGVKDNLCAECLFHANWESGTLRQHYSLRRTKGQDPAIRLA